MGMMSILYSLLAVLSIMMIATATIIFWVNIGGKIGPHRRKLSLVLAIIGWALFLCVMWPFAKQPTTFFQMLR